jgi:hypothetical protein
VDELLAIAEELGIDPSIRAPVEEPIDARIDPPTHPRLDPCTSTDDAPLHPPSRIDALLNADDDPTVPGADDDVHAHGAAITRAAAGDSTSFEDA